MDSRLLGTFGGYEWVLMDFANGIERVPLGRNM